MIHGDDFIFVARAAGREHTLTLLKDHFQIKHDTAGPGPEYSDELKVLGRVATCHSWGWSLEADPSLLEVAVDRLGLADSKGAATPGVRPEAGCGSVEVRSRRMSPKPLDHPDMHWPAYDDSKA